MTEPKPYTAPAERWQHGQECVPAGTKLGADQVASGLATLHKAGAIGAAELVAAGRYVDDYVQGIEGVRETETVRPRRADIHDAMLARSAAITRHRMIADVIGAEMCQQLVAFLVEDLSFSALAKKFMPTRTAGRLEMAGRMTALLQVLTGLYANLDRQRPNAKTSN